MAILKNIFQNVAVLYSLFIIVFLAWGLNKGLDLTDEGLYLLQLKYPLEYGDSSNWLSGFLGLINLNVTGYRLVRLVLTIFLSGYLTVHLSKFIQKQLPDYSNGTNIYVVFAFVFSGAALSYSIYPLTISYNTVTLFSLLLVVGQLFWLLNIEKSSRKTHGCLLMGLGVMIMMVFVSKFTSGAVMLLVGIFFINGKRIIDNASISMLLIDYMLFGTGMLFFIVISPLLGCSIYDRIDLIIVQLGSNKEDGGITAYLSMYYVSIADVISLCRAKFSPVLLMLFCLGIIDSRIKEVRWRQGVQIMTFSLALSFVIYDTLNNRYLENIRTMIVPLLTILLAMASALIGTLLGKTVVFNERNIKVKWRLVLAAILCLVIPFIGSVGTNNLLSIQSILFMFSWSVLILLLSIIYANVSKNSTVLYLVMLSVIVISGLQLYKGMVLHPYRISQPLNELTIKLEDHDVYVDDKVYKYYTDIKQILKNRVVLEQDHPMLDINGTSGLIYLLGGKSPGSGWNKNSTATIGKFKIMRSKMDNLGKTIVFAPSSGMAQEYVDALNSKGANYPKNYETIGTIKHYVYGYDVDINVPKNIISN